MTNARPFVVVLVTAPDLEVARRLAALALEAKLIACANLVRGLESHYWWQGKLERSGEVLILMKTRTRLLRALEALLRANHPYDTPEIIAVPLQAGSKRYLDWIADNVRPSPVRPRRVQR